MRTDVRKPVPRAHQRASARAHPLRGGAWLCTRRRPRAALSGRAAPLGGRGHLRPSPEPALVAHGGRCEATGVPALVTDEKRCLGLGRAAPGAESPGRGGEDGRGGEGWGGGNQRQPARASQVALRAAAGSPGVSLPERRALFLPPEHCTLGNKGPRCCIDPRRRPGPEMPRLHALARPRPRAPAALP